MSKRITAALATGVLAVAMSVPSVSLATKGGAPSSHSKACPSQSLRGKDKDKKAEKNKNRGKHCGVLK